MSRPTISDQQSALLATVRSFPEGVAIGTILEDRDISLLGVSRRTIVARLNELVERGHILRVGKNRGVRYFPVGTWTGETEPTSDGSRIEYHRSFLRRYRPNETFYLTEAMRSRLHSIVGKARTDLPAGTYLRQIYSRVIIDLSWASSRLEGNTYSLLETERLLNDGVEREGADPAETQMVLNHKRAIELLLEDADEIGFNTYTICNLHALLTDNLMSTPEACGRIRSRPVGIRSSRYVPPSGEGIVRPLLDLVLEKGGEIDDPFEAAFFTMVHIPYLQPFEDGNKRTSRLAANIPFVQTNLPPLSYIDSDRDRYIKGLLALYEERRVDLLAEEFCEAYEKSAARYADTRQQTGEPDPFRIRYRDEIYRSVSTIVRERMNTQQAVDHIRRLAEQEVPTADRERFLSMVEEELRGLHEGNIARYRLRPGEFEAWSLLPE